MASIWKHENSQFHTACFTDSNGKRIKRSTKSTDPKAARRIAEEWEKASRVAQTQTQARNVLAQIYEATNNEPLRFLSTRQFLTEWAESRKVDTSKRTADAYAQVAREFIASLGPKADDDLSRLRRDDVNRYRNGVLARTSSATANKHLKYLRVALGAAWKNELTEDNVAKKVDTLKRGANEIQRRAFTEEELDTLLKNVSPEWKNLIQFGLYTGQRLGDLARLTWRNIDLVGQRMHFFVRKGQRHHAIPLAPQLVAILTDMGASDDPSAPLFPNSAKAVSKITGVSPLSQQFNAILVNCGLAEPRSRTALAKRADGKGRNSRRPVAELSFHSLRHSTTTFLKRAGVSESHAMAIVGHKSKAVSNIYTHLDEGDMRAALAKLPDFK